MSRNLINESAVLTTINQPKNHHQALHCAPCPIPPRKNAMHLFHDVDVLLLLATAMAAKRRPAEALDIVAAIDLLQNNVPTADKLSDAFPRLAAAGLLTSIEDRVQLTAGAEAMIETLPRKAETAERLFALRQQLADWTSPAEAAVPTMPIAMTVDALRAAILAHRTAAASTAKNLLVAKPKPAETSKRPGQRQRKPMPARRRKD